jgi:Helicase conserved C-terminal domain
MRTAPPTLPDPEEIEEMEETERERLEEMIEAITLSGNAEQVREEIAELRELAGKAKAIEDTGLEAKLGRLKGILQDQGFFDKPDQRLLLFTEFKDTLDYLVGQLKAWGFKVGFIHGDMKPGSREEPGSRIYVEQQFREGEIQVLVATEAAGEGINLQCCHILFNYDIPWNPNRLVDLLVEVRDRAWAYPCAPEGLGDAPGAKRTWKRLPPSRARSQATSEYGRSTIAKGSPAHSTHRRSRWGTTNGDDGNRAFPRAARATRMRQSRADRRGG